MYRCFLHEYMCVDALNLIAAVGDSQVISEPGGDDVLVLEIFERQPAVIGWDVILEVSRRKSLNTYTVENKPNRFQIFVIYKKEIAKLLCLLDSVIKMLVINY